MPLTCHPLALIQNTVYCTDRLALLIYSPESALMENFGQQSFTRPFDAIRFGMPGDIQIFLLLLYSKFTKYVPASFVPRFNAAGALAGRNCIQWNSTVQCQCTVRNSMTAASVQYNVRCIVDYRLYRHGTCINQCQDATCAVSSKRNCALPWPWPVTLCDIVCVGHISFIYHAWWDILHGDGTW